MDWLTTLTGSVAGLATGGILGALRLWRWSSVASEQIRELTRQIGQHDPNLKDRVSLLVRDQERFENEMANSMKEATEKLYSAAARIATLTDIFAVQIGIVNKSLEGIVTRQEEHTRQLAANQAAIQLWGGQ